MEKAWHTGKYTLFLLLPRKNSLLYEQTVYFKNKVYTVYQPFSSARLIFSSNHYWILQDPTDKAYHCHFFMLI